MTEHRPPEVSPEHLQRVAVTYHRRSVPQPVQEHQGGTGHQPEQREHARRMGWAEGAIVEIQDPGVSGTTADRAGFQRLLKMVERGEVGAVFVRDVSRLSRSQRELELFLAVCRVKDVVVVVDGEIMQRQ